MKTWERISNARPLNYSINSNGCSAQLSGGKSPLSRIRLFIMRLGFYPLITDDWSWAPAWCKKCGGDMVIIRPGDFRCSECED